MKFAKNNLLYKKILIKFSGESLSGKDGIFDLDKLNEVLKIIVSLSKIGVNFSIVIGGGNIWRGANNITKDRIIGDYMGMTATIINALALKAIIEDKTDFKCHIMSKINFSLIENYSKEKATSYINNNEIVIFAGGTGNPCFTTDTGAALFAIETGAEAIFMAKNNIDGVYDSDPNKNHNAKLIKEISLQEIIKRKLKVMDLTALTLLEDYKIKIHVFSLKENNFLSIIKNSKNNIGTFIHN